MTTLCDCHIHIVGDTARYPMLEARQYTPGPATVERIRSLGAPLGITRFVVVQPSFYGADNSLLCDALRDFGGAGRGVAVVDPARATDAGMATLARAGVCGLRINLYSTPGERPGQKLASRFADVADLAHRYGWHVQVIAPLPLLIEASSLLEASPVPVVIDHYGLPAGQEREDEARQRLLALMRRPHLWMKLSAPYRSTGDSLAIDPDRAWLAALLEAGGERCVWGSDWPHTPPHEVQPGGAAPLPYRPIDYSRLVAAFHAALPDAASAERIMGTNAARLYGFAA
ncbi:amidohydrolase family protein [Roseomonas gilardii]|uniref:amidohydrolase family protein n=1 Tax=Roseomonas gilardii TaxID=257708 RepID=UPI0012DD65C6|nr:amidohydrolase family protein [Roseomonas gilardii]